MPLALFILIMMGCMQGFLHGSLYHDVCTKHFSMLDLDYNKKVTLNYLGFT